MNPPVYTDENYDNTTSTWNTVLKQVTLFPIIPTISYGLSW